MKAIQFDRHGGAEVLQVVERDMPTAQGHDVVVRNRAIGVN